MKKFSDEERERIRKDLIETGSKLLLKYGPKKTTVKDITEPVGIAKPTFYQFFDAKSDLYLVIIEREMKEYIKNVRTEVEKIEDPQDALERFFWRYVEFGEENPLIQETVIQGNHRDIIGNSSWEKLDEMQEKLWAELIPILENIQEQSSGPITEMDPLTVGGLMSGSLGWLMIHKDDYEKYENELESVGSGYYDHIQELLISVLARGLTVEK